MRRSLATTTLSFERLHIVGSSAPAPVVDPQTPDAVAVVLREHGPGSLFGIFRIPLFGSELQRDWTRRAQQFRERGFWAGVPESQWQELQVVAADSRGWGIAMARRGHQVLLGPDGAAYEVHSLEELKRYALLSFPTTIGPNYVRPAHIPWASDLALELDDIYVAQSVDDAVPRYLNALTIADESGAQELFETLLSREPLLLAYTRLLWTLCGQAGASLPVATRREAIALVATIARRREPCLFGTWIPRNVASNVDDREVIEWAASSPTVDLRRGPFAGVDPLALPSFTVGAIADSDRPPLNTQWVNVDAVMTDWAKAWNGAPAAVDELLARCSRLATRHWPVQLINGFGLPRETLRLGDRIEDHNRYCEAAVARLVAQPDAWLFGLLAVNTVSNNSFTEFLAHSLDGIRDPLAETLLSALVLEDSSSVASAAYAREFVPSEAMIDAILARLRTAMADDQDGFDLTDFRGMVSVLVKRLDLIQAKAFALKHFSHLSDTFGPALGRNADHETIEMLRAKARHGNAQVRVDAAHALVAAKAPDGRQLLQDAEAAYAKWASRI